MDAILITLARMAGIGGVLLAAFAVLVRLSGRYVFGGFETSTLLLGAVTAMAFAGLCYAEVIAARRRS